jgi:hypothetical protein
MPFLSAIEDGAWAAIDSGWELTEHHDRIANIAERRETIAALEAGFEGGDKLSRSRLAEELDRLNSQGSQDAKYRLRSWKGWWHR